MRSNISCFLIHSSVGADLAFKGLIAILRSELAFSINILLTSVSDILFTDEVHLCKNQ